MMAHEALPQDFINEITQMLGSEEAAQLCYALTHTDAPTSIRVKEGVQTSFPLGEKVAWCSHGNYLEERPQFTLDPLLHAGCYYVQEAASMFIEQAWKTIFATDDIHPFTNALDLCAAPGGKSTLWRTLLPDDCHLTVNEPDRKRAEILNENLIKWGHPRVLVTNAWPADFGKNCRCVFDVIGADVPCSGEGMFRKDANSRNEWSIQNVDKCAELQRNIIEDVWPSLKEGGWLVYSTCTFNTHEDEENVAWICETLGAEVVAIPTEDEWGITATKWGYHFYPHKTKGEGFFLALLRKKGNRSATATKPNEAVKSLSKIKSFAREAYEQKGKKQIPNHWVALTDCPEREQFPRRELTLEEARQYLRREVLVLPPDAPRGYVIVCHKGHPLGFVNNLGTRANNMYPQEWRIRHL